MTVELLRRSIPLDQQRRFAVNYKGEIIGEYIPDLIAYSTIIIEIKTIKAITNHERGQVINYLRLTGLKLGLILNFKKSKLEWERIILKLLISVHSCPFVV
jgi:GxxExxY protein